MINDNYETYIIYKITIYLRYLPTAYVEKDTSTYLMSCFFNNKLTSYYLWVSTYNISLQ